ncbi:MULTISPECIES: transposase [Roseobacteraceae]|uniref:transposase n=1 Tax=Roseobacteraceae TaxID=2854170 RepID=UPI001F082257|nr:MULTISPECIES: transposase [Roseobacteraceae]
MALSTTTLAHCDAVWGGRQPLHLEWYALRWKIETFFRTLKSGCRIEELRLATADRLANCIALRCVVTWRVTWLAMLSRKASDWYLWVTARRTASLYQGHSNSCMKTHSKV